MGLHVPYPLSFFFKFNEIIVGYEYLFRALKNSLSKQIVKRFV